MDSFIEYETEAVSSAKTELQVIPQSGKTNIRNVLPKLTMTSIFTVVNTRGL